MTISDNIVAEAQNQGVDPDLALAVARRESGLNPSAVSPKGAIGVFQLMPATARELGVNPHDVAQNIQGGIAYLRQLASQFGGDIQKTLAAYNWGPSNVVAAVGARGGSWLSRAPAETVNYVRDILSSLGGAIGNSGDAYGITVTADGEPIALDPGSGVLLAGLAVGLIFLWIIWG